MTNEYDRNVDSLARTTTANDRDRERPRDDRRRGSCERNRDATSLNDAEVVTLDSLLRDRVGDFLRVHGSRLRDCFLVRKEFDELVELCARAKAGLISVASSNCADSFADVHVRLPKDSVDQGTSKSEAAIPFYHPVSRNRSPSRAAAERNLISTKNYRSIFHRIAATSRFECANTSQSATPSIDRAELYEDVAVHKYLLRVRTF